MDLGQVVSGGQNVELRGLRFSWDHLRIAREAGVRVVQKYGTALERLAEDE